MRSVQSTLFALLAASSAAYSEMTFNLTQGVSPISHDIYQLHMTVFWICVAIGVLVFGTMFYAMFYHRKSRGHEAAHFHSHPVLEITWTIVPVVILVLMAIPATKVLLNMNNNDQEDITIKITGYQWKWHYEYFGENVSFFSNISTPFAQMHNEEPKGKYYLREVDHPIVVPIHKKIRFLITSNDVNHAWWVPDLGVKRDAIAGTINEAWARIDKPGTYRGQCAELCGFNHAFMPIVVVATTEQGYKDWLAQQKGEVGAGEAETNRKWTMDELMKNGGEVYRRICAACHQPMGVGLPPTYPALKGSKVTTGSLEKHIETVMHGVPGTAMQAFQSQLTSAELASVITFERNAWGNNTNTSVQPIQIKAYHDGKPIAAALLVQPGEPTSSVPPTASGTLALPVPPTAPISAASPAPTVPISAASPAIPTTPMSSADILKAAINRGEKVFLSSCAVCHQPNGLGMPPVFPALKGNRITISPDAVNEHINTVMNGHSGTAMQGFKDQLKDQDLADVITYERNAWGNNTGSLVTPDHIKVARQPSQKP